MAWSDAEETRVVAIETIINNLQSSVHLLVTKTNLQQLATAQQEEIDSLSTRIDALERMTLLLQRAFQ
jgi:hypothetical protein